MPENPRVLDEKSLDYLESHIPELALAALTAAYWNALAAGLTVLVAHDGAIYEDFPDGTRKFIKAIKPPTPAVIGAKVILQ
jgi:hypothetical protein